ncbi:hypothetical protein AB0M36_07040 [Actinoplanes sp. NPDC051346]|uniref:hypothetical protein n=1 Tax=Actinoplanes sp. NPDC051346 TaxID=3155048 RepID=UPI00342C6EA9
MASNDSGGFGAAGKPAQSLATRIPLAIRVVVAAVAMVIGAALASFCTIMAVFQYGGGFLADEPRLPLLALYTLGIPVCLTIPIITWWFLLPRARWFGIAALVLTEAAWILLTAFF